MNGKAYRVIISAMLLVSLSLMFSCKTTRSIIKEPIKEEGADYLFRELKNNELRYEWLSAKFNLDLIIDKVKTSFKGQIRIRKDSVIWISFSPALGIEIARLMITNDSINLINRINNTYFTGDYQLVNNFLKTSIDFDILQSFVTGNDFQYYEISRFRAAVDNMEYRLSTAERHKLKNYLVKHEIPLVFVQNIWLDPTNFKITKVNIREMAFENRKLEANYSDFAMTYNQLFPTHMTFDIMSETKVLVTVDFSKIEIDKTLRFPFSIPSKFARIQ